jgi:hypothetical protein
MENNSDPKYRLDRTVFKATNAKDADDHVTEWKNKSYLERLEAAWFLINQVYGTTSKTPLDRTVFSIRKRNG